MINVTRDERGYILAGNYQLLDAIIAMANREILLLEKKYDEMLERKNAELAKAKEKLQATVQANPRQLWNVAAQELKAENKRMREALTYIMHEPCDKSECESIARAAMKGGGECSTR